MDTLIILAAKYLYLLVILIALGWVYFKAKDKTVNIAKLIVVSFPLAYISAKTAGHFYYNARPFVVENIKPLISHAANNGFPSDHTLLSMTIASVIFVYHRKLGIFLAILSLATGYARIAAKIHHQIDVLAAAVIAIAAVYISVVFLKKLGVKIGR